MGKYSGIFMCSDFDGTLTHGGKIPQGNIDAIRYFTENGGIFSVVSGRNLGFLKEYADTLCLNSYVACINGCEIYYMPDGSLIRQVCLPTDACDRLCSVLPLLHNISDVNIFKENGNNRICTSDSNLTEAVRSYFKTPARKALIHNNVPFTEEEMALVRHAFGEDYIIARSWETGLEISNAASHKGIAARDMANMAGAHTLVCVGNYENDIELLKAADIGYAVADSLPSLIPFASRITVPAKDAAIAAIVNEL